MNHIIKLSAVTCALLSIYSPSVLAAANGADARSAAMGGTGVASANYLEAGFYNPALAVNYNNNDDFGLILPTVGVAVNDKNDLINNIDNFKDVYDRMGTTHISEKEWQDSLKALDNSKLDGEVNVGLAVSIPNKYISMNLFTKAQVNMLIVTDISDHDLNLDPNDANNIDQLTSTVTGFAGGTADLGIALAKSFDLPFDGQTLAVGISPKFQKILALKYQDTPAGFDESDFNAEDEYVEKSTFNVDFGLAYKPATNVTVAFAAQNIIKQELDSNISHGSSITYLVEPKYSLGVAYDNDLLTVAFDIDLNKQRYFEQLDHETQFARIGAEFDMWQWAQLRAGYSLSMTDYANSMVTAGIGFKPFGVFGIDLAGQYGEDNNYGASLQFVLTL